MVTTPCRPVRAGRDDGFMLIEVLVSALLLITVSLAALRLIDDSGRIAGNDQGRALAANIAQSEIERIRALPVEDVVTLPLVTDITDGGKIYKVRTATKWVSDGQDAIDCTRRSGGVDYMRVSVSADWAGRPQNSPPVKISTIITPVVSSNAKAGSLSVYVKGSAMGGNPSPPVAGVPITITGPATYTASTNGNGCVTFPFIPVGAYNLTASRAGFVTPGHAPNIAQAVNVSGGQTTKLQYEYDSGGFTGSPGGPLRFTTRRAGAGDVDTQPIGLSIVRGSTALRLQRTTPSSTWDLRSTPLWPSDTPYQLYAGSCAENGYPDSPAGVATYVNIPRNATQNVSGVRLPSIDVEVWSNTTTVPGVRVAATVKFYPGCGLDITRTTNGNTGPLAGRLDDPGFPYTSGTGTLCVSARTGTTGTGSFRRMVVDDYTNNSFYPTAPTRIYMASGTSSGATTYTNNATC